MKRTKDPCPTDVEVGRLLRAPVHRVFAAWTEPELLALWWGPEDVETHEFVLEPKVGGRFRWTLSDSDRSLVRVRGEVTEIVTRERIEFTWMPEGRDWPKPSRVTVGFREAKGVIVRVLHTGLPDMQAKHRHENGWISALNRLERLLCAGVAGHPKGAKAPGIPGIPGAAKPRHSLTMTHRTPPISTRMSGQR